MANSRRTRLDEVLTGRGISTKSLARLAQVSPGTVRGWRDGTTVPSLTCGRRAAVVLGMTLDEFADLCERGLTDVK